MQFMLYSLKINIVMRFPINPFLIYSTTLGLFPKMHISLPLCQHKFPIFPQTCVFFPLFFTKMFFVSLLHIQMLCHKSWRAICQLISVWVSFWPAFVKLWWHSNLSATALQSRKEIGSGECGEWAFCSTRRFIWIVSQ